MKLDGPPPNVSYRSLLKNRNYAALWMGQLVSVFGDRLHQIALLVLVGSLTENDLKKIGLVLATIGLPTLLFGLFAGALADRMSRRRVMIAADLVRAALVVTIPILARVDFTWVYVITFLLTTASLFFRPSKDGTIPNIVRPEELMTANSLSSATDTAMDVVGYPLAGALVGGLTGWLAGERGIDIAFYIDGGTYLFSALMIYRMKFSDERPEDAGDGPGGLVRMVGDGLRFIWSNNVLLTNTMLIALGALVAGGAQTLAYGYAIKITDTGGFGFSILEAAIGLGNLLGSLLIGWWGSRLVKGPTILFGLVLMGLTDVAVLFVADLWFAAMMLMVGGVGNMLFFIPSVTLVQQLTPDVFRGRVFSFRATLITLTYITSNVLLGIGGELFGVQQMFGLSGTLLVLVGLVGAILPSARQVQ